MEAVIQMELIPSANDHDIDRVVELLTEDYHQWLATIQVLNKVTVLSPEQELKKESYSMQVEVVNTAIDVILDKEVRDVIKHRYLKSERRKNTIARFSSMSESTIDRRIEKGLKSIANTLKDCGMLYPLKN